MCGMLMVCKITPFCMRYVTFMRRTALCASDALPSTGYTGYNRYSYINNNPLSATDPSGHGFFGSFFSGISRLVSGAIRSVGRLLNNSFRGCPR